MTKWSFHAKVFPSLGSKNVLSYYSYRTRFIKQELFCFYRECLRFLRKYIYYGNPRSSYLFKRVGYFKEVDETFKVRQSIDDCRTRVRHYTPHNQSNQNLLRPGDTVGLCWTSGRGVTPVAATQQTVFSLRVRLSALTWPRHSCQSYLSSSKFHHVS